MVKICIQHNLMCSEDGVWLKKLEDVTEIVRENRYICSIEDRLSCPECQQAVQKKNEFQRGDNGKTQTKTQQRGVFWD
jgi:hypothetical protein